MVVIVEQHCECILFIYFILGLCLVFVTSRGLSLVVVSWVYSLVAVHGLLIVVASLVVEHSPKGTQV